MRMYPLSKRSRFYQETDAYVPGVCYRAPVCPGMTFSLEGDIKFQTAPLLNNTLTGAMMDVFFFYVPNRLLWDEWTDFIAQTDGFAGTFPVTSTAYPLVYDRDNGHGDFSALARRAYKLCYNEFFGQSEIPAAWFGDITNDTDISQRFVRNTEQISAKVMRNTGIDTPEFVTSSGTPPNDVSIDLNEFARQMRQARSMQKAQLSGDKYVDALRRMGVNPDWRIQNAPEFIGKASTEVRPVKEFSTYDDGTSNTIGISTARYEGTVNVKTKRISVAEHGYVIGIQMFRPHVYYDETPAPFDAYQNTLNQFFVGDNDTPGDLIQLTDLGFISGAAWMPSMEVYRSGQHIRAGNMNWGNLYNGSSSGIDGWVYAGFGFDTQNALGGSDYAMESRIMMKGSSPIAPNRI